MYTQRHWKKAAKTTNMHRAHASTPQRKNLIINPSASRMHVCVCHLKRYCYSLHMPNGYCAHEKCCQNFPLQVLFYVQVRPNESWKKSEREKLLCKGKECERMRENWINNDGNNKRIKRKIINQQQQQRISERMAARNVVE